MDLLCSSFAFPYWATVASSLPSRGGLPCSTYLKGKRKGERIGEGRGGEGKGRKGKSKERKGEERAREDEWSQEAKKGKKEKQRVAFYLLKKGPDKYGEILRFDKAWVINGYLNVFCSILCFSNCM